MTDAADLIALLRSQPDTVWDPEPPASEPEIAAVEQSLGLRFPDDYRRLLLLSSGGGVYGAETKIVFLPVRHLTQFNPATEHLSALARMVIFADDQGDFFFYFDPHDLLGRGAWAVYGVEKSIGTPDGSKYAARDLRHLVARILAGDAVLEGPTLAGARS
jgi:hypothetical protein